MNEHLKSAEDCISKIPAPNTNNSPPSHPTTTTYATALINPPPHANLKIVAREGIWARQFLIKGIKKSRLSHLDTLQLKMELNKIFTDIGLPSSKIWSITNTRNGGTTIELDSDEAASWLSNLDNQCKISKSIDTNTWSWPKTFTIIAFNGPPTIDLNQEEHWLKICDANDLDSKNITSLKWAKPIEKRSSNQKTAHLILTMDSAILANKWYKHLQQKMLHRKSKMWTNQMYKMSGLESPCQGLHWEQRHLWQLRREPQD